MNKNIFLKYSVAMVTPFTKKGEIDRNGIKKLVKYYIKNKVPALLISGSTGEQHSMSLSDRVLLYNEIKNEVKDDMLIYGGVASILTEDAVYLAKNAEKIGLDGIMLGFPPYIKPNQDEAYDYVEEICNSTNIPIMLYNNPARTGFNLEIDTLKKMTNNFPNILAYKEAGDPKNVRIIEKILGKNLKVLSGSDTTIIENYYNGYDGITSIVGNIFPKEINEIIDLLYNNKEIEAKEKLDKIKDSINLIVKIGATKSIKHIFYLNNIDIGKCKKPIADLTNKEKLLIKNIQINLI
jgi:4-hydroxy-tetrahydrodipicolinate synthase